MVGNKQKLKARLVACLVALTLATNDFSFAEVIGAVKDPILLKIAPLLHKEGVDVFGGNARAPGVGERPRVELMSDFDFDIRFEQLPGQLGRRLPTWLTLKAWTEGFNRGMFGGIGAAPAGASTATKASEENFRSAWDHAPPEQRVFISFARPDLPESNKIEVLESHGYITFTYLNEEGKPPTYSPEFTGEMFSKAGLHLVLDTPAARMSLGVLLEKKATVKSTVELSRELREFLQPSPRPPGLFRPPPQRRPFWQEPTTFDERLREAIEKNKAGIDDPARRTGGDERLKEPRGPVK